MGLRLVGVKEKLGCIWVPLGRKVTGKQKQATTQVRGRESCVHTADRNRIKPKYIYISHTRLQRRKAPCVFCVVIDSYTMPARGLATPPKTSMQIDLSLYGKLRTFLSGRAAPAHALPAAQQLSLERRQRTDVEVHVPDCRLFLASKHHA